MKTISFLADLTSHLNDLNKKLQGKELNICKLVSTVGAFQHKLSLFREDLKTGQSIFTRYKEIFDTNNNKLTSHDEFLTKLISNFAKRFNDFVLNKEILQGVVNPFGITAPLAFTMAARRVLQWIDIAILSTEVIDLQENISLNQNNFEPVNF